MAALPESFEKRRRGLQVDSTYWLMMSKISPVATAART
jgi:hypothetical protein